MKLGTYKKLLLFALPFVLLSILFLYYYTIERPASLNFGHTSFVGMILLLIALLSALTYPFLLFENVMFYKELKEGTMQHNLVKLLIMFQIFHVVSIFTYEDWSNSIVRIPICVVGLVFFLVVVTQTIKFFLSEEAKQE